MCNLKSLFALSSLLVGVVATPAEFNARTTGTPIGLFAAVDPPKAAPTGTASDAIPQIKFVILTDSSSNMAFLFSFDPSAFHTCIDLSAAGSPGTNNALLAGRAISAEISPGLSCVLSKTHNCESQTPGDTVELASGTYQLNQTPTTLGVVDLSNSINSYSCVAVAA